MKAYAPCPNSHRSMSRPKFPSRFAFASRIQVTYYTAVARRYGSPPKTSVRQRQTRKTFPRTAQPFKRVQRDRRMGLCFGPSSAVSASVVQPWHSSSGYEIHRDLAVWQPLETTSVDCQRWGCPSSKTGSEFWAASYLQIAPHP